MNASQSYSPTSLGCPLTDSDGEPIWNDGYEQQYGVRVGGIGGRIVARELKLNRDQASLLCEMLEHAREAGREESVSA